MKQLLSTIISTSVIFAAVNPSSADTLAEDVKEIVKAHTEQKFIRCVLNKRPRCLAIHVSPELSVAYDTQLGALAFGWKPKDPKSPITLNGAVYTGKHGPQPTIKGDLYFESNEAQYSCSNPSAKLRYLGHEIDSSGLLKVNFAFQDDQGNVVAKLSEAILTDKVGDKTQLIRQVYVEQLTQGVSIKVKFPNELIWKNVSNGSVTLKQLGGISYSTLLKQ